jgi:hypothetical protein
MAHMTRAIGLIVLAAALAATVLAQVPPGPPYDPAKHINPIITYVGQGDFQSATYQSARDATSIELLGLGQDEATRESIEIARPALKRVRIGLRDVDVIFYPVVREKFRLKTGSMFTLDSFKFPKVPFPPQIAEQILDQAAFAKPRRPADARFGPSSPPEMLRIRGSNALLFEDDGNLTVFWIENGIGHTAAAKLTQKELLELVDDLL